MAPSSSFEPLMPLLPLPPEVEALRRIHAVESAAAAEIVRPRIEGHVLTMQLTIDTLVGAHRRVTEEVGVDLAAETRWVAVWEMSGRCLSLANAVIDQLRRGFGPEAVPTMRTLHEANRLLFVFSTDPQSDITVTWLRDERSIKPSTATKAQRRIERGLQAEADDLGIELTGPPLAETSERIYDLISRSAHNRRGGFAECISRPLRSFGYGPHADSRVVAEFVDYGTVKVEETALEVGGALASRFLGRDFYNDEVRPLLAALHAVRETHPLDAATLRQLGR